MQISLRGSDKSRLGFFWFITTFILLINYAFYSTAGIPAFLMFWSEFVTLFMISLMLFKPTDKNRMLTMIAAIIWLFMSFLGWRIFVFENLAIVLGLIEAIMFFLVLYETLGGKTLIKSPADASIMNFGFGFITIAAMLVYALLDFFVYGIGGLWGLGILVLSVATFLDLTTKGNDQLFYVIGIFASILCLLPVFGITSLF